MADTPKPQALGAAAFNPQQMYTSAESMRESSSLLAKQTQIAFYVIPSAVLGALALEIMLKLLILLEGNSYRGIHDLHSLYKKLTPEHQAQIKDLWTKNCFPKFKEDMEKIARAGGPAMPDSLDIDYCLSTSKNAFVTWRYDYEGIGQAGKLSSWIAGNVIDCVRTVILSIHPEWENKVRGWEKISN